MGRKTGKRGKIICTGNTRRSKSKTGKIVCVKTKRKRK